jgi:hypothetical protein
MEEVIQNIDESDFIIIPNPIYDVVFRYLMEDPESAMIVVSTLINENIINLQLEPITHSEKKEKSLATALLQDPKTKDDLRLFHLDFTATVLLPDGTEELIMIELQKATEPDDIFRFKRYISRNFQKKHEVEVTDIETLYIRKVNRPIRLVPVFILNFRIENEINDLLIRTKRVKEGFFKNKALQIPNEFIDNLSYDLLVVQLPNLENINKDDYLDDEYKKKLFALLKLFDQKSRVRDNEHRLRLIRKFFPGFLDRVIRRLQSADIDNPYLEEKMFNEDEYLKALIDRDNKISFFREKLEKTAEELGKTFEQLEKTTEELGKTTEELGKTTEELGKTTEELGKTTEELGKTTEELENEKNKTKQLQVAFAKSLKEIGIPIDKIQKKTGLPTDEIEKL